MFFFISPWLSVLPPPDIGIPVEVGFFYLANNYRNPSQPLMCDTNHVELSRKSYLLPTLFLSLHRQSLKALLRLPFHHAGLFQRPLSAAQS